MTARIALPLALVVLSAPVILFGIGSYSLVNGDEGIYHYMARHMVEAGDWFRLEFTGEERVYDTLTHAPLFLWGKALVILFLGDSYFSMRVLSACLGILSLLATYRLVEYLANPRAAFLAGLVQLTTFQFVYMHAARTGEMETAITLSLTLSVLLFLRAIDTGKGFAFHHLCLIALINLKLALVAIPLIAEAAYFAIHPSARGRLRDWVRSACWMIPLGLAWHGYQWVVHAEQLGAVIHDLTRQSYGAAGGQGERLAMAGQVGYYAKELVFGAYPHALFYPWAIIAVMVGAKRGRERSGWTLVALYIASAATFFLSITLHQPWYLIPVIPLAAAFTGAALDRVTREVPRPIALVAIAVTAVFAASIRLPLVDFNPFAERAAVATPEAVWRDLSLPLAAILSIAILVAALATRRWVVRPIVIAAPLIAGLLLVGGVRVLAPLRFVDHVSESERLKQQLDAARREGTPIEYPVVVRENGKFKARYHFGDDFSIRRLPAARRAQGEYFALRQKDSTFGTPPSAKPDDPSAGGRR